MGGRKIICSCGSDEVAGGRRRRGTEGLGGVIAGPKLVASGGKRQELGVGAK